ncbi:MAG: S41 family peptidase [Firmicutes bacterium]|nr:S41 family peptidase [Bacillota bacterium]
MVKIANNRFLPWVMTFLIFTTLFSLGYELVRGKYRDFFLACQVIPLLKLKYYQPLSLFQLITLYWQSGNVPDLLASLGDPYTRYLSQQAYTKLLEENEGTYGGVGIYLEYKEGELIIFKPMKNSPADRAGLLPGDRIIAIDHQPTKEMSKEAATAKILGPPGTKVVLSIARIEGRQLVTRDVTLTRALIDPSLEWEIRNDPVVGPIGWINLTQFSEKTAQDLGRALEAIARAQAAGLVLDLRYNPGGLLVSAVEVSSQLLPYRPGTPLVSLKYRDGRTQTFTAYPHPHPPLPLVVLVNEWSASSAEIVASAIKDLQAGVLVGNTTFGKGLVQDVIPLPTGGALYLTVATYLTAGGHSSHQTGIRPHVVVTFPEAAGAASIPPDLRTRQRIDHLQTETALRVLRNLIRSRQSPAA